MGLFALSRWSHTRRILGWGHCPTYTAGGTMSFWCFMCGASIDVEDYGEPWCNPCADKIINRILGAMEAQANADQ